jgi:hypothetical protein
MSQTIPFTCPKRNILHIFKHFGMLDCKPIDTPLPIGQMFTKNIGPKNIYKTYLMKGSKHIQRIHKGRWMLDFIIKRL